jgi:xylan 1,4-beta-xylosidase
VTPPATIDLTVQELPHGVSQMSMEQSSVDYDHSNAYTAWQAMGSPQNPSAVQLEQLKAAGQLQLLGPRRTVSVEGDTIHLTFSQPREGLSLLDFTW